MASKESTDQLFYMVDGSRVFEDKKALFYLKTDDLKDFAAFYQKLVNKCSKQYSIVKVKTTNCPEYWDNVETVTLDSKFLQSKIIDVGQPEGNDEIGRIPIMKIKPHKCKGLAIVDSQFQASKTSLKDFCVKVIKKYGNQKTQDLIEMYQQKPTVKVQYPTDLDVSLLRDQTHQMNMHTVPNFLNLDGVPKYGGIQIPYFYVSPHSSVAAAHIEDYGFGSWNVAHRHQIEMDNINCINGCKIWVAPKPYNFHLVLQLLWQDLQMTTYCINILMSKIYLLKPEWYAKHNLEYDIMFQEPGDMIITFPRGVHAVINIGLLFTEACNFAFPDWLTMSKQVNVCNCGADCIPSKFPGIVPLHLLKKWNASHHSFKFRKFDKRRISKKKGQLQVCSICNFVGASRDVLKLHFLKEHNENRYECPICGKKFKTSKNLSQHRIKSHIHRVYYRCSFCSKSYFSNYNLKRHTGTMHCNNV